MRCADCGAELVDGAELCLDCGAPVTTAATDVPVPVPAPVPVAVPVAVPVPVPVAVPVAVAGPGAKKRGAEEEVVRCKGCGVPNPASAARCRGCGERMRLE